MCDDCGSLHDTIAGLAGHKRFCEKGLENLVDPDDDVVDVLGLDIEEGLGNR